MPFFSYITLPFIVRITVTATSAQNPVILLDSCSLRAVTRFLQVYLKLLRTYVWELTHAKRVLYARMSASRPCIDIKLHTSDFRSCMTA